MCVGFHVKGMCNEACPKVADHVAYNDAQYGPLVHWCGANYPTANQE